MKRRFLAGAAALTTALLALTGCGASADPAATDGAGSGELDTVSIGVLPIVPTAALRLGVEQGFFEEAGINVVLEEAQAGAAVMASVVSGEYQIGFASLVPQIQAFEQGLPIQVIGTASSVSGNAGLVVPADSPIQSIQDLEGKRIGVVALKAIDELSILGAAEQLGADPSSFEVVSVPFPEMMPAVESGRVDAVELVEPFYTAALEKGYRVIIEEPMGVFLDQGATNSSFFTSNSYLESNKDVVDRFIEALIRSNEYATEHPEEIARIVPTFTSIAPEVASAMIPTVYGTTVTPSAYEAFAELMAKYGVTPTKPDLNGLIYADTPTS